MGNRRNLFAELKRRNVLRAGALYVGAVWLLAQVITQLGPLFHAPEWAMRGFVIAGAIGFPFWLAFAWFYEFTPQGLKRESEIAEGESITHHTGRKLDFAIIGVLALAVVLLVTNQFVLHRDATSMANAVDAKSLAAAVARLPQKSVAVLPFANDSGDKDQQYFSDGLSEDLINALSQFQGLKVISRHSAFEFRDSKESSAEIGQKLGVTHLLEGSVQKLGDEVRISATLVNAADGSVVWSEHYDRPYTDLFALQDAITKAVSGALKAKLLAGHAANHGVRPPSGNVDAWQAYKQGSFYLLRETTSGRRKALTSFETATRLDPRYAVAYSALAGTWMALAGHETDSTAKLQAYAKARAAVDKALALAPDLASAHVVRAHLLGGADSDWAGAQAELQRAAQLAPNDIGVMVNLSMHDGNQGRLRPAVDLMRKALAADPLHAGWNAWLGSCLMGLGDLDAAQQALTRALELQPGAEGYHGLVAMLAIVRGDAKAALAAARLESEPVARRVALAQALQIGPDRKAADAALQNLIAQQAGESSYQIAEVYALRRDPDNMFKWLDRAWTTRDSGLHNLLSDPFILRYRNDPRFAAFCKQVGLPTTTDAVAMK